MLAICDFDMKFTYVYAGWEGSAHDSHILRAAQETDPRFPHPPADRYYLVDSGYSNTPGFLAPYRGTRYHLTEYQRGGYAFNTHRDLFNYRHSRLRNVIERSFGVLKKRFPILRKGMASYELETQVDFVIACCALHNFIRMSGGEDELFDDVTDHSNNASSSSNYHTPNASDVAAQGVFRDNIAHTMWVDMGN